MNSEFTNLSSLWEQLRYRLEDRISVIRGEQTTTLQLAQHALPYAIDARLQIQSSVEGHVFAPGQEVQFYKSIKPYFIGQVVFYSKLLKIEMEKPPTGMDGLKLYYAEQLTKLATVVTGHSFINNYIESGFTNLDDQLFFRPGPSKIFSISGYECPIDGAFPICYEHVVGELIATNQLKNYLINTLEELKHSDDFSGDLPKLAFTLPKAKAIELIYALYAKKCFNHGKAQLKDIVAVLGVAFNIDPGNYARTFQEFLSRKKGTTVFVDELKESLLIYVDQWLDRNIS